MAQDHEHPATPEQVEHGFDEGLGKRPRPPAQRRIGRFGDTTDTRTDEALAQRRFSEGLEDEPADLTERQFSEGYGEQHSGDA